MSSPSQHHILVVDDEPSIREILARVLTSAGYDVVTAEDGFEALLQLRRSLPHVIISDLNMPLRVCFLSAIRRRFPQISVIAMSGAYQASDDVPDGVIADAEVFGGPLNHACDRRHLAIPAQFGKGQE